MLSGFTLALLVVAVAAATDPGEIKAVPGNKVVITPSYLDQLKAEAERTGKVVVWTGAGHDFGGSAVLFDAVPVLMDREDVGKPLADIKNKDVRRTIRAVKMRLSSEMPTRSAVREFTRTRLRDFASGLEQSLAGGEPLLHATEDRTLNLDEQATLINTAVQARNEASALTEGVDPPMYEPCGYGDVCDGCYTVYYHHCTTTNRCVTNCAFACTSCPIY